MPDNKILTEEAQNAVSENVPMDKDIEAMFRAGVHFGYSRSRRHPRMSPFIFGIKNNVEIFDLEKVKLSLEAAEVFLQKLGEAKKNVLWVGTKPSVRNLIPKIAKELGNSYVAERWLGGTLTNAKVIKERLKYFDDLKKKKLSGELEKYTKKEQLEISRELKTLERYLGGIEGMKSDLAAIVIVDPKEEKTAFREAVKIKLPVVAILSSDSDPLDVTYPIPANDSSPSSVGYILNRLAMAYQNGLRSASSE